MFVAACKSEEAAVRVSVELADAITLDVVQGVVADSDGKSVPSTSAGEGIYILTLPANEAGSPYTASSPGYQPVALTWRDLTSSSQVGPEGMPATVVLLRPDGGSPDGEYILPEMASPGSLELEASDDNRTN